jgi:DNA topoisomerase I
MSDPDSPPTGAVRRPRLRRSDPSAPGLRRIGEPGQFIYLDVDGSPVSDPHELGRIQSLRIPPAWQRVWIAPDPLGHLQATGVDKAGRTQYLYHELWTLQRDREKYAHMEAFAVALPGMRYQVVTTIGTGADLDRETVLACALRLLDVGLFRIGSEVYEKEDGHLGLATLRKENVTVAGGEVVFTYIGKSGVAHVQSVSDPAAVAVVSALARRLDGGEHLLAYRAGDVWHQVHAEQINEQLKRLVGDQFSAKNFRTWNGTVVAAASLAAQGRGARTQAARNRAMGAAALTVSEVLGNTPAVARRSYIDPRVFDRYLSGWTVAPELEPTVVHGGANFPEREQLESAVLDLLRGNRRSVAIEHFHA